MPLSFLRHQFLSDFATPLSFLRPTPQKAETGLSQVRGIIVADLCVHLALVLQTMSDMENITGQEPTEEDILRALERALIPERLLAPPETCVCWDYETPDAPCTCGADV